MRYPHQLFEEARMTGLESQLMGSLNMLVEVSRNGLF